MIESFRSRRRRRPLLAACVAVVTAMASVASAEVPRSDPHDPASAAKKTLYERNRVLLHDKSDPLQIVGQEQAGNDIRSSTPALARAEPSVRSVETSEAYERTIAMYAGRKLLDRAPALQPEPRTEHKPAPVVHRSPASRPVSSSSAWTWIACAIAVALGALAVLVVRELASMKAERRAAELLAAARKPYARTA